MAEKNNYTQYSISNKCHSNSLDDLIKQLQDKNSPHYLQTSASDSDDAKGRLLVKFYPLKFNSGKIGFKIWQGALINFVTNCPIF